MPLTYEKSSDEDDDYDDADSIFGKSQQKQPLLSDLYQEPVLLSASLFQRNIKLAQVCVMLSIVLERAAYYSLLGNLAYFVNGYLKYSSEHSAELVTAFSGMTWLSCFIGGVFGDVALGRFKTILTGLILYVIGFINLPLLEYVYETNDSIKRPVYLAWLIMSLLVISLGEGCFKSNMSPFGADQLGKCPDNEIRSYFNYFYWAINIGSLIGFSLLTWLQQKYGFIIGYTIPTCLLLLALFIFCIPRTTNYHVVSPSDNILKKIYQVLLNSRRKRIKTDYESFNPIQHWLDRSKVKYGGKFSDVDVEDVKTLLTILPVFGFLIVYCICYYQVSGTFLLQGLHMRLIQFSTNEPVPPSWFSLFNVVIVLIFVPIIDRYVYPMIERCHVRAPYMIRMCIGMLLVSLSMVAAGTLEMYRIKTNDTIVNHIGTQVNVTAQNMNEFYQIPQYALMGISEIFVLITGLEFAYCQSPKAMQSFVTSLFFVANGLGSFLGAALISLGNSFGWNILNAEQSTTWRNIPPLKGNLYCFFYFLAALNFLNLLLFIAYACWRSKKRKKRDLERTVAAYIQGSMEPTMQNSLRQF